MKVYLTFSFKRLLFTGLLLSFAGSLWAQRSLKKEPPLRTFNSAEIQEALRKSQVLGSVLYVAAHPDDENTRLITYLAKGRGFHTTYLSMTRGDGGQNSLGPETGPMLGIIRTQELLAARNIDGGHQRFTRAIDFGYSKNPEETLEIWDKEKVLGDVVRTIRELQPDIIITRFPGPEDGGGGHGHHTASFILAREAFDLAGDANAYSEQIAEGLRPWQVKRLFWNNWRPYWGNGEYDAEALIEVNIGEFNPLLGMSYGEIADLSASQHRCQDWGRFRVRGPRPDYLELKAGQETNGDYFEDIDATWGRIEGGEKVGELLAKAEADFQPANPSAIVPLLVDAYRLIEKMPKNNFWVSQKQDEVKNLIVQCTGLWFEALSDEPTVCLGDSMAITTNIYKRSSFHVSTLGVSYMQNFDKKDRMVATEEGPMFIDFHGEAMGNDEKPLSDKRKILLPNEVKNALIEPTQPYWLTKEPQKGIYQMGVPAWVGKPETEAPFYAKFEFAIGTENPIELDFVLPVVHKYRSRTTGEHYRPMAIVPKVTINLGDKVYLFGDNKAQKVSLVLKSNSNNPLNTSFHLDLPDGWEGPSLMEVNFEKKGEEVALSLEINPPAEQSVGTLKAEVTVEGDSKPISYSQRSIEYEHFPTQLIFPPAEAKLVRIGFEKKGDKIGYIMGPTDDVPGNLEQVGYEVTLLADEDVFLENLQRFDAVVSGARVYSARKRMPYHKEKIMEYVKQGGTYVMQYNKTYDLGENAPGPYPIKVGRSRVTREEAPITILIPDHPAFNTPNKITEADFEGWIQERGLYFPTEWDEQYEALTSCNDPGEDPLRGSLLVTKYGDGYFVYTSYSFFRELPAGVPGAYRLFANLLSLGK